MIFSVVRLTILAGALFGMASAAPVETSELKARAPASVITKCTQPKTVALTFDDGPYVNTKKLVDLLDANGAKGTWFFNGNNFGCIYDSANADSVKYAYDKGHQVASHTWAHKDLATLSGAALLAEFTKVDDALKKITGATPAFMRPPFGSYDAEVQEAAGSVGQTVVIWDFDSGDSAGKSAQQSKDLYTNAIAKNPNSILTLNHETYATTVNDVIPYAIQQFKAKGYNMVTVAECLGESPYQSTGSPSPRDSSWTC
ncbi:Carbohydrate esterase 4 protein [Ceratobasidium sp. 395]|nr:Carbohydrate esterase 4 protein [Ceratobasidium sp. 395]